MDENNKQVGENAEYQNIKIETTVSTPNPAETGDRNGSEEKIDIYDTDISLEDYESDTYSDINGENKRHRHSGEYKRRRPKKDPDKMNIYDWVQCLISALLCGILLFMFVGRVIGVKGTSMLPTLYNGDRAIISNLFFTPSYGDIVVLQTDSFGEEPIVKRVIATEGQTVDIDFEMGIVYVNDVALEEDYTNSLTNNEIDFEGKVTVPENCIFVMGDNRNASNDSRDKRIGMVDTRCIMGKVYFIVFPGTNGNDKFNLSRLGSVY